MFRNDLEAFRATRAGTLAMANQLTQTQMDYSPAPQKWTAGEVLDHLLLADGVYRSEISELIELERSGKPPVLKRSLADLDVSVALIPKTMLPMFDVPFTLLGKLLPRSAREFILRSRMFPAKNPDRATPRKGRAADTLREELEASLEEIVALLETNADIDYRKLIHRHPLLGVNNVLQMIRFMTLHELRHQDQITELSKAVDFPAAR